MQSRPTPSPATSRLNRGLSEKIRWVISGAMNRKAK
jgi:hypothetical protein